jgi:hypothetical protein
MAEGGRRDRRSTVRFRRWPWGRAGARHSIIAAASHGRLAVLDYDMPVLARLMAARDWTTINLVWRESDPGTLTRVSL